MNRFLLALGIVILLLAAFVFALWHYGRMLKWCC